MIRRPPRSTLSSSSAASDVYKRQGINAEYGDEFVAMVMFRAVLCLASLQMALGLWRDCGDTNATLHFQSVGSIPDPLHTGQNQTIFKHGWSDVDIPGDNLASTFSQYWCFTHCHNADGSIKWNTGLPWVRFLKIEVDVCKDHPDMCPVSAGKNFSTSAVHPKLNPLTPHGWYRSQQQYHDKRTGEYVGCADMIFQYISAAREEDAVFNPLN
eukprot:TRINITY_DN8234_c0_g1_i1.p1 TRINITY_DN8234_c0_g1~~TRINITY_DN8234_c0_g1_i1.p1  ORF type:complete len:212 (+),score=54.18 TRINITY_DN8234_c0_g1_i1:142-777(+)